MRLRHLWWLRLEAFALLPLGDWATVWWGLASRFLEVTKFLLWVVTLIVADGIQDYRLVQSLVSQSSD